MTIIYRLCVSAYHGIIDYDFLSDFPAPMHDFAIRYVQHFQAVLYSVGQVCLLIFPFILFACIGQHIHCLVPSFWNIVGNVAPMFRFSDLWETLRIWKDSRLWKIVILCILSLWEKFFELSSKNCRLCDFKCHGYIVHPTNLGWPVYDFLCISQQNHSSRYVKKRKRAV